MKESAMQQYGIVKPYIIFVGGLQPRKNLVRLLRAFELVRDKGYDLQLVIVGGDAWLADGIHRAYARSPHAEHVVMTGTISGDVVALLLRGAAMSAYVPLYEGFGMPILEAFAAQTPVLTGRHSSLQEVAGRAAHFCDVEDVGDIAHGVMRIVDDLSYAHDLRGKAFLGWPISHGVSVLIKRSLFVLGSVTHKEYCNPDAHCNEYALCQ